MPDSWDKIGAMKKAVKKTVDLFWKAQRAGEGASPVRVEQMEDHFWAAEPKGRIMEKRLIQKSRFWRNSAVKGNAYDSMQ